jgi:phosphate uptake regulator
VRLALHGLVKSDRDALLEVIAGDDRPNRAKVDVDDLCLHLLARFHPVAVDLRVVVSALRIDTDLERVGDLAVNIGEAGQRYLRHPPVKPLVLNNQIVRELLTYMLGGARVIEPSLDLILIARHLERIGDHATNIAGDVIFLVQARDVRHRSGHPLAQEKSSMRRRAWASLRTSGAAPSEHHRARPRRATRDVVTLTLVSLNQIAAWLRRLKAL